MNDTATATGPTTATTATTAGEGPPPHKNQFIELPQLAKANSKPSVLTNASGTGTWKDFVPLPSLPKLSGWLQRQDDALFSAWKKRYFRLEGDKLYWFRNDQQLEHLGFISLREVEEVSKRRLEPSKGNLFQLELKLLKNRRMFLWCEDLKDQMYWLDGINQWKDYFVGQMNSLQNSDAHRHRPVSEPTLLSSSSTTPASPVKKFGPSTQKSQSLHFLPEKARSPPTTPSDPPVIAEAPPLEPNVKTEEEIDSLKRIISEKNNVIEEWKKLFNEKDELYKIQEEKLETLKLKNTSLEDRVKDLENELQIIKNRDVTISSFLKSAKEQYFKLISTQQSYDEEQANKMQLLLADKPVEEWVQYITKASLENKAANETEAKKDIQGQQHESTTQKENLDPQKTDTEIKTDHLHQQKEQNSDQDDTVQNSVDTVLQNPDTTTQQNSDDTVIQKSDSPVQNSNEESTIVQ